MLLFGVVMIWRLCCDRSSAAAPAAPVSRAWSARGMAWWLHSRVLVAVGVIGVGMFLLVLLVGLAARRFGRSGGGRVFRDSSRGGGGFGGGGSAVASAAAVAACSGGGGSLAEAAARPAAGS